MGMASLFFSLVSVLLSIAAPLCKADQSFKTCGINAIYQLGDSTSDTGNLIRENPQSVLARPPYGQNFFKNPTGRSSNGQLIIDYFATSASLPFLDAYLKTNATFYGRGNGVNFAVAGATALPSETLANKKISSPVTNSSLSKQLDWMSIYLNGICKNADCAKKLEDSIFMVGEIGGNDYTFAQMSGKTPEEIKALVPEVVKATKEAVTKVVGYGAPRVVVFGHFPMGCFPISLTDVPANDSAAFDELHCLKNLNALSLYHNEQLQKAILELKTQHPNVAILYGDFYNAFLSILRNVDKLGFDAKSVQKACCGIGGDYNFNVTRICGSPGVPVCPDPQKFINWDGVHLTQQAYYHIFTWLIRDISSQLRC
ncbi:GDSL esterase/lipase [Melia azedarach]|uniref:GDSL esterase/lipase n=1 Tax=Melia azedarach TaxID=155640 RepID=A0ACC1Y894_MELAZ|nr:GDSL esterase/lipase [Melia azedarach]